MQILGLLAIYFDAAVVHICHQLFTFIQIGSDHTVIRWFIINEWTIL